MPNFGIPDRDLLDRISRLEARMDELSRAHGAPISAIRDVNGTSLVSNDPVTGVGLQRPYIPIPLQPADYRGWPKVPLQSTVPVKMFRCQFVKQHPALILSVAGVASANTTGAISVRLDGEDVWPQITFGQWPPTVVAVGPIPVPGTFMSDHRIEVWANFITIADGASEVYVTGWSAYGTELRDPLPTGGY